MPPIIETLARGLTFTECPRWHQGALWFSDFYSERVYRLDPDGTLTVVVEVPGEPAGLGWNADGELLIVAQRCQQLLRFDGRQLQPVADLGAIASGPCNDMVVAANGDAYIGNWGFDLADPNARPTTAAIALVRDGQARVAADGLAFPNGAVLLDDDRTLVVAETMANRLSTFRVADDGSLHERRVWAELDCAPDGIASDGCGGIWVATLRPELQRVVEGGQVTDRLAFDQTVIAVTTGGEAGDELYVCTTAHVWPQECRTHRSARIERVRG